MTSTSEPRADPDLCLHCTQYQGEPRVCELSGRGRDRAKACRVAWEAREWLGWVKTRVDLDPLPEPGVSPEGHVTIQVVGPIYKRGHIDGE
jgi:hypothetical protein